MAIWKDTRIEQDINEELEILKKVLDEINCCNYDTALRVLNYAYSFIKKKDPKKISPDINTEEIYELLKTKHAELNNE